MFFWNGWQLLCLGVLIRNIAANHLSGRESTVLRGIGQELSFPSPSSDFRFRSPPFPETGLPLRRTLRFPQEGTSSLFRISPFQQQQDSLFGGPEFQHQGRQFLTQDLQPQGRQFLTQDLQPQGRQFLTQDLQPQGRQFLTLDLQHQGRQFLRPDFQQPPLRNQFPTQGFQHMPQGSQLLPSDFQRQGALGLLASGPSHDLQRQGALGLLAGGPSHDLQRQGALGLLAGGSSQRILDTSSSLGIPTSRRIRIPSQFSVPGRTPSVLDSQLVSQPVEFSRRVLSTRGSGPIDNLAALRERLERIYGGTATGTGTRDNPIRIRASLSSQASLEALQPHIRQTLISPAQRSPAASLTRQQAAQGRRVQQTRTQQVPQTGRRDDQIIALFGFDPVPSSHGTDHQSSGMVPKLSGSGHQESGIIPKLSGTGHHSSSSMLLETGHHASGGTPEMSETVDKRASVKRVPIKISPASQQIDSVLSEGIGLATGKTATDKVSHTDGFHVPALDITKSTSAVKEPSHTDITSEVKVQGSVKSLHSDVTVDATGALAGPSSVDVTAVQDPTQVITKPALTAEVSILGPEAPVQTIPPTELLAKVPADIPSHTGAVPKIDKIDTAVPKIDIATQSVVQDKTATVRDIVTTADVTTPEVIISTVTAETPEPPEP